MVEEIENEVSQVLVHIQSGNNFLLSGGAGSGKTYSLVQVIKKVIEISPISIVACMTYTNSAVREIEERVNHPNLKVSTIHDFLWDNIKSFHKDIQSSLIEIINDENYKTKSPDGTVGMDYYDNLTEPIRYRQGARIRDGIISHDEVIELASYMFKKYAKLGEILKDKYPFIFVDEYQDTHPAVIEILLNLSNKDSKRNIVGLFGDTMQSIYDEGVGDVNSYIDSGKILEVKKIQNRRNPQSIITLANTLRNDGIQQKPSADLNAPNMISGQVKQGSIRFIYSDNNDLNYIKSKIEWNFSNAKETKELNLTHNLIASKAGFGNLMEIYDKDPIMNLKIDIVKKIKDNEKKGNPDSISEEATFGDVVDIVALQDRQKNLRKTQIIALHSDLYNKVKDLPFTTVRKIYLDKDNLLDDKKENKSDENRTGSKRDSLIRHLFKIYHNVNLYQNKQYNEFIRTTQFPIVSIQSKIELKSIIELMSSHTHLTIGEVIEFAHERRICFKDDSFNRFIENNEYLYERVKNVLFSEFINLYNYLEGYTPFSTQHKIKGAEFDNVLVVLDNGGWNKYNFEYLFDTNIFSTLDASKKKSYPGILSRTQKIFYVCCTRAKENLVVFYHNPSQQIIDNAKNLFSGNVLKV